MVSLDKKLPKWKLKKKGPLEAHDIQETAKIKDHTIATVRAISISPPSELSPGKLYMSVLLDESGRLNYGTTARTFIDAVAPRRDGETKWAAKVSSRINITIDTKPAKSDQGLAIEAAYRVYDVIHGAIKEAGECIMTLDVTKGDPHCGHNLREKKYFIVHLHSASWHRAIAREEGRQRLLRRKPTKQLVFDNEDEQADQVYL
jgi:hypothetical protein